jgi:hypothetical protein
MNYPHRLANGTKSERDKVREAFAGLRAANTNEPVPAAAPRRRRLLSVVQWVVLIVLAAVAVAYFTVPGRAMDDTCTAWTAEMLEDEGGEILTASVCASEGVWLMLACFDGNIWLRYDLAAGSPVPDTMTTVTFTSATGEVTLDMLYQEMDGMFSADVPAESPLVTMMRTGDDLTIFDENHAYAERMLPLAGANAALDTLLAGC